MAVIFNKKNGKLMFRTPQGDAPAKECTIQPVQVQCFKLYNVTMHCNWQKV